MTLCRVVVVGLDFVFAMNEISLNVKARVKQIQYWAAMEVQQSSVTQMLIYLTWQDLAQRRTDTRLSLMYKIVHNLVQIEAIKYFKL